MANKKARDKENDWATGPSGKTLAEDTVDLRLPAKTEYMAVLRATVGVIAGGLSSAQTIVEASARHCCIKLAWAGLNRGACSAWQRFY